MLIVCDFKALPAGSLGLGIVSKLLTGCAFVQMCVTQLAAPAQQAPAPLSLLVLAVMLEVSPLPHSGLTCFTSNPCMVSYYK